MFSCCGETADSQCCGEGGIADRIAYAGKKESLLKFRPILGEFLPVRSCSRIGAQKKFGGTLGENHRNFRIGRQGLRHKKSEKISTDFLAFSSFCPLFLGCEPH